MPSSLIIYFTPYTKISASAIIDLADLALKSEMDVADTPSLLGLRDYTPLAADAEITDEREFEHLMLVLWQWPILHHAENMWRRNSSAEVRRTP